MMSTAARLLSLASQLMGFPDFSCTYCPHTTSRHDKKAQRITVTTTMGRQARVLKVFQHHHNTTSDPSCYPLSTLGIDPSSRVACLVVMPQGNQWRWSLVYACTTSINDSHGVGQLPAQAATRYQHEQPLKSVLRRQADKTSTVTDSTIADQQALQPTSHSQCRTHPTSSASDASATPPPATRRTTPCSTAVTHILPNCLAKHRDTP